MKIELNGTVNDRLQELKSTWNKCYRETGNWNDMRFAIEQLFLSVYGNIDGVVKEGSGDASENETIKDIVHEMNCSHEGMIAFEFMNFADRIEKAYRRAVNGLQNKMRKIVMQMQMEKGDVQKCEECHKRISWDEFAVNFGLCDDCLNKHLKEDGLA